MEQKVLGAEILKYDYDVVGNKTCVRVQTHEFTDWLYVSGRVPQSKVLALLRPTIDAMLAEFGHCTGQVDIYL